MTIVFFGKVPYIPSMETSFTVTPAASARIAHLLATEPKGSRLRVSVEGGGCSGFQYHFDFDAKPLNADDKIFGEASAPVVVDEVSLNYVGGSQLDYVATIGAAAFEIKNPNAKASCGCGNSFSVAL
jgi:iron-sulfur cluster assembly accessory protein